MLNLLNSIYQITAQIRLKLDIISNVSDYPGPHNRFFYRSRYASNNPDSKNDIEVIINRMFTHVRFYESYGETNEFKDIIALDHIPLRYKIIQL